MIGKKIVQKFGNSGHIVLPKEFVGKRIRVIAEPKGFEDIKHGIVEILKPYFQNIIGVYLYGSYARNEQTLDSDVDILAVTDTKLKIADKAGDYSIVSINIKELEKTLNNNAVLVLPIIKEAITIINPELLERYKNCQFTKKNTAHFIDSSRRILSLDRKGLGFGFEVGSLVYSIMLRIRGLLMIKSILNKGMYSKSLLFSCLMDNSFPKYKIDELYYIYTSEKKGNKIAESNKLNNGDISKLLNIFEMLLADVENLLK